MPTKACGHLATSPSLCSSACAPPHWEHISPSAGRTPPISRSHVHERYRNIPRCVLRSQPRRPNALRTRPRLRKAPQIATGVRSEEHTSELQSRGHLVCRLLLEKKKTKKN